MNRDNAILVAGIVDRITKLEKTIFEVQQLLDKDTFTIIGSHSMTDSPVSNIVVSLNHDEIATVVFTQDIIELYINTLNLELCELIKELEKF
jgi:hypothetical protein